MNSIPTLNDAIYFDPFELLVHGNHLDSQSTNNYLIFYLTYSNLNNNTPELLHLYLLNLLRLEDISTLLMLNRL